MADDTLSREEWQSNRLTALAVEIGQEHTCALRFAETAARHAIRCGERLIEAKALCRPGQWLGWLKGTGVQERTAQQYMQVARVPPEKRNTVSVLSFAH
jgi:hypothetical protein